MYYFGLSSATAKMEGGQVLAMKAPEVRPDNDVIAESILSASR